MGDRGPLALVGGTVYVHPTAEPVSDGAIVVQAGKIVAVGSGRDVSIPRGAEYLDCHGLTIAAGFWNSHVHFFERKWAHAGALPAEELRRQLEDAFTRFGFTSVFDTGSMWENTRVLRDRIESGEVSGPKILSTGEGLLPPGAMPPEHVLRIMGLMQFPAPEIADATQAADAARSLLAQGVDGIKVFASSPAGRLLEESSMRAVVNEAHRAGKPVFVHPNNAADVTAAIRSGVDVVAHTTPASGAWEESLITQMVEARVALTPTLMVWKHFARHDRLSVQEQSVGTAVRQLHAWHSAGGSVLFGTDLGACDYDPREEYVLMRQAGMNFRQILAALTTVPAERFGEAHRRGRVAVGCDADLVVLNEDPSNDVCAFADVAYTMSAGNRIYGRLDARGHFTGV